MKHTWTGSELRYLVSRYPNLSTVVIAVYLEVSISAVYNQAYALGLKKSDTFLSSPKSGRFDKLSKSGKRYRFAKGHVPANKGKKMPEHLRERIRHTWFKKGNLPNNTKFNGHVSVRLDGDGRPYAHIRVSQGRYELLHRHIWQQANGSIPEGKIVVFKNGDSTDLCLDNLELITRQENMLRNTKNKYPKDLQQAIIALNKLKKALNYGKE